MSVRFPIFMLVSLLAIVGILALVLRSRPPAAKLLWLVGLIVGPGGMLVAKYGTSVGMPWWIYYTVPMLLTVVFPVMVLHMTRREAGVYLTLVLVSAPAIHVAFSLTLGWREYMPFLPVP